MSEKGHEVSEPKSKERKSQRTTREADDYNKRMSSDNGMWLRLYAPIAVGIGSAVFSYNTLPDKLKPLAAIPLVTGVVAGVYNAISNG